MYTSHVLKDPDGKVVCPALYVYVCPICNNTGHKVSRGSQWSAKSQHSCLFQAHTVKHCPYNPDSLRKQTELAEIWKAYRYFHSFLCQSSLRPIIADLQSLSPRRCQSFSTAGPSPWWAAPSTTRGWAPPPPPPSSSTTPPPRPPRPWCRQTPLATSPTPPPQPTAATQALSVNSNKFNNSQSINTSNNSTSNYRLTRVLSMRTSLSSYNTQVKRHRKSSNIKIISSCILLI